MILSNFNQFKITYRCQTELLEAYNRVDYNKDSITVEYMWLNQDSVNIIG